MLLKKLIMASKRFGKKLTIIRGSVLNIIEFV